MSKLEEIKDFVMAEKLVRKREKLLASTRLSEDIGLEGDDADEFLEAFAKKFNVDFSQFDFHKYFAEEGWDPIRFFIYMTGLRKFKAITLMDLEKAAEAGKWIDSE